MNETLAHGVIKFGMKEGCEDVKMFDMQFPWFKKEYMVAENKSWIKDGWNVLTNWSGYRVPYQIMSLVVDSFSKLDISSVDLGLTGA